MSGTTSRPDPSGVPEDLDPSVLRWLEAFAAELGVDPPTGDEVRDLLSLAGVAARGSARQAAPVACWLAARAGSEPSAALSAANSVDIS